MANDSQSLSHTKWNCKYHIVFAPKFRRQIIYGQIKADIGKILRQLCEAKKVEIIEAEACPNHIHMLVSIPPYLSVAQFVGYLKGKSSLMIFDRHANLKYKYGNRHFWCRGYYVDTVGRNKERIAEYIRNQLQEDAMADQISMKEHYIRTYGNAYELPSPRARELRTLFHSICAENGILDTPEACFEYMFDFPENKAQISLFDL